MSDRLLKESEVIKAVSISCGTCLARNIEDCEKCSVPKLRELIKAVPSADRPQGDVDAVAIFEHEMHNLEQGYITIGEFDERIEPLRHLCYGRPQGKWICEEVKVLDEETDDGFVYEIRKKWKCSNCNTNKGFIKPNDNFCSECGADMREKGADYGIDNG